ncbi:ATP-dependent Clp protease proteolytic subunit, partial [Arthrospira sp. O9.13F]
SKGKRASLPNSMITLYNPQTGTQGQATDIQVTADEILSKRALMMDIFHQNTGQTIEKLTKDMNRTFYMTPEEAKEYGIIDRVLTTLKLT